MCPTTRTSTSTADIERRAITKTMAVLVRHWPRTLDGSGHTLPRRGRCRVGTRRRRHCTGTRPDGSSMPMGRSPFAVCLALSLAACSGAATRPTTGAIVTFNVASETFRVRLTSPEQIDAAQRARAGSPARIPNGRLVAGTQVNTGWSWHLEDVEFAEVTIELCDGRPSDVEREGTSYGGGRYCPWSATIVSIEPF